MKQPRTALRDLASPNGLVGGPFGSSLISADYVEGGVPVIRGGNMTFGPWLAGDFAFVSAEKYARDLTRNTAVPGDLVFTQRGTLGQVAVVPDGGYEKYVVSQSQMRLRIDPKMAHARYVYYACSSPDFQAQVRDHAISTGVPHINLGILGSLTIPSFPIKRQRAIAEVLEALDDKIAANARLMRTCDDFAQFLTRRSFGQHRCRLGEIAELTMGSSPPGASYNEERRGVIFYQGVRDFGVRHPRKRVWTSSPVRVAQEGDVLISVRAPVGRVNVASEPACIGRGLAAARSTQSRPHLLYHVLRAAGSVWAPFEAEGTVFGSINQTQLTGLLLPLVPEHLAPALEARLSAFDACISSALGENDVLTRTRDELLPLLMSGKVRVKDAERVVEEVV